MIPRASLPRFAGLRLARGRISICFTLAPMPWQQITRRDLRIVLTSRAPFVRRLTLIRRTHKLVRPHPWPRPAA